MWHVSSSGIPAKQTHAANHEVQQLRRLQPRVRRWTGGKIAISHHRRPDEERWKGRWLPSLKSVRLLLCPIEAEGGERAHGADENSQQCRLPIRCVVGKIFLFSQTTQGYFYYTRLRKAVT